MGYKRKIVLMNILIIIIIIIVAILISLWITVFRLISVTLIKVSILIMYQGAAIKNIILIIKINKEVFL